MAFPLIMSDACLTKCINELYVIFVYDTELFDVVLNHIFHYGFQMSAG